MCGIAGILAEKEQVVRRCITSMLDAQKHRGPDDCGEACVPWGSGFLAIGQRRLSIIDLSPAGHQPMVDPATGSQIVFNGEIYNFNELRKEFHSLGQTFRGYSDTEVILYGLVRWGPDYVKKLQGMFALAFYDAHKRTLLLARDSLGIKPLYVARPNGMLLFASEVRGILASGLVSRTIDRRGLASLLAYGAVQQPATIIEGIESFPPGCYQIFRENPEHSDPAPTRFWSFPDVNASISHDEARSHVRQTLDDAVRDHLVADRPVGVFLSSGLDSTIVAALAAKHSPHIRSFTIGFADQRDLSERELAEQTARQFGLEHESIDVSGGDALEACRSWLASLDQPSFDGLNTFLISKVVRERGIVVALSGLGGDELFGGYPSFGDVPRLQNVYRRLRWLPAPMRVAAFSVAGVGKSIAFRQKLADVARTDGSVLSLCLQRRRAMSDEQLVALGLDCQSLSLDRNYLPHGSLDALHVNGDPIGTISQVESTLYQGNVLLRDSDTNGMAHSLEIRVPMLDQRMLNLAYSLPGSVRLPGGTPDKHLLRTGFADLLRPELLAQKKRGFTLPIRRWMQGPLRELCESSIATLKNSGLLRPKGVDAIWQLFLKDPESPIWSRAMSLTVLGNYLRA